MGLILIDGCIKWRYHNHMSNPNKGPKAMKATITTHIGYRGNKIWTVSLNGISAQTGCPQVAKRLAKHIEKIHG